MDSLKKWWQILGPGILYAGAAIGVSHLVQSTRAGASFGSDLIWAIIIANIIKYPFFKLGSVFTFKTGESLIYGYKSLGKFPLLVFLLVTLCSMFIIQAAITLVTSGLFYKIFGLSGDITISCMLVILFSCILLSFGKLDALNSIIKVIIIFLSLSTVFAVFTSIPESPQIAEPFDLSNSTHYLFFIALIGWMPGPMDLSVWQSQWYKDSPAPVPGEKDQRIVDFNIGYIGTALLALCFLKLGQNLMYGTGISFENSAVGFSGQIIGLYEKAIGPGFGIIISICVLTTMFSTTLTCMDAFPRVLGECFEQLDFGDRVEKNQRTLYLVFLCLLGIGAALIIIQFQKNLKGLVDFATSLSFLSTPVLSLMNYLAFKKIIGDEELSFPFRIFCGISLGVLIIFCGFYIFTLL